MNKAIKYRIYPTVEQCVLFVRLSAAAARFIISCFQIRLTVTRPLVNFSVTPAKYKEDYPYLKEVDSLALANKQMDLQSVFRNCFSRSRKKKNRFPSSNQPNIAASPPPRTTRKEQWQ